MEDEHARSARSNALSLLKKRLEQNRRTRKPEVDDGAEPAVAKPKAAAVTQNREADRHGNQSDEDAEDDGTDAIRRPEDMVIPSLREPPVIIKRAPIRRPSGNADARQPMRSDVADAPITRDPHDVDKAITKLMVKWSCRSCQRECIPVREESRCLCGHRYKEHPTTATDDPRARSKAPTTAAAAPQGFQPLACTAAKCPCRAFFYVVAEGAWILRCRCKHKHVDHDPGARPHRCRKPKCPCEGFDSPWVCNCDHPWGEHMQETVIKTFHGLSHLLRERFQIEELNRVQRTDLLAEPIGPVLQGKTNGHTTNG